MSEYCKQRYGVPSDIGRRIEYRGELGTIWEDGGNYIAVNMDKDKPGHCKYFHPTTPSLKYLDMGTPRKLTRGQQRYRDFVRADWFSGTFLEWLQYLQHCKKSKFI